MTPVYQFQRQVKFGIELPGNHGALLWVGVNPNTNVREAWVLSGFEDDGYLHASFTRFDVGAFDYPLNGAGVNVRSTRINVANVVAPGMGIVGTFDQLEATAAWFTVNGSLNYDFDDFNSNSVMVTGMNAIWAAIPGNVVDAPIGYPGSDEIVDIR